MDSATNMTRSRRLVAIAASCLLIGCSAAALAADDSDGKQIFTETAVPSCTVCHTLADAGSTGAIGPDLDELQPDAERVYKAVTDGIGVMPPFADKLSEEQRKALAAYVADVAGS